MLVDAMVVVVAVERSVVVTIDVVVVVSVARCGLSAVDIFSETTRGAHQLE